jgi:putative membrane protein
MIQTLLTVKALHIIFIVTWFAGLFYIVRLFVYQQKPIRKKNRKSQSYQSNIRSWQKGFGTALVGLIIYHIICHLYFLKLQQGVNTKSGTFFRIWNEVATLFLVAIVFLIVMKSTMNWVYGTVGFILFGIMIMLAVKIYKKVREKSK